MIQILVLLRADVELVAFERRHADGSDRLIVSAHGQPRETVVQRQLNFVAVIAAELERLTQSVYLGEVGKAKNELHVLKRCILVLLAVTDSADGQAVRVIEDFNVFSCYQLRLRRVDNGN